MKLNFKAGLLFATLGFAIVVVIGILYLSLSITPSILLLRLAPALVVFATEDVGWTELLVVVAPLNAALYGGCGMEISHAPVPGDTYQMSTHRTRMPGAALKKN